jgi:hypothetical protein
MKTYFDFRTEQLGIVGELSELSNDTLGGYAKKAHQYADAASRMSKDSPEMAKIANKRSAGAQQAVRKMGAKTGTKGDATRTANNIKTGVEKSANWRTSKSDNEVGNKKYVQARAGIGRQWDRKTVKEAAPKLKPDSLRTMRAQDKANMPDGNDTKYAKQKAPTSTQTSMDAINKRRKMKLNGGTY